MPTWWKKKHPCKDKEREIMHRRAQRAEAALERASFWIECIEKWGVDNHDRYLVAIANAALKEMKGEASGPISV